ncbi:helix-turn-helix domain-containing protein [Hymenobacter negativus]|uniref:Helix-turn-helix domain-containing protein n=1 Tax=Hymenobacter negativus TaxID=2795026 RepID=A0ABS3QKE6_9BACT|nr:helix-turn-helix domain-containing protein [Hymenobacter negativus]MBO2011712.1 helix-turn-helix domain-containing protein [Hymenobacter negativus]
MEPPQLLAATLIANRKRRGLSQEELAEAAGLSLRTVQRLEKGESLPRGFTLQALATALELPVEALTSVAAEAAPQPAPPTAPEPILPEPTASTPVLPAAAAPDDGTPAYVALMYLSAFSYILLPGANIVLPLLMRYHRRQVPEIQEAGSRLLNFELVWTLVTYGGYGLLLATQIILIMYFQIVIVLAPLVFLFTLNLLHAPLLLLGAWRARQGRYTGYPVGLRLF